MSDSILVRVTLDSYDLLHPREKQTQVHVQIPEVSRVSWLLPAERFHGLKDRAWPEVVDVAQEHYDRGWAVSDSVSQAARDAVVAWLRDDANRDEMQAAYEADQARQHPVARKLLKENEQLRNDIAGACLARWEEEQETARLRLALASAQRGRRELRSQVAALLAERHSTNESLDEAVRALRERNTAEAGEVFVPQTERSRWVDIAAALNAAHDAGMPVGIDLDGTLTDHRAWSVVWDRAAERWTVAGYEDESAKEAGQLVEWCTGCNTDHDPDQCGYRPGAEAGDGS